MRREVSGADRPRVVIIGSGFGGLFAAKALRRDAVEVTLISTVSHHLFQPLLYQVATGVLSTGEIAPATREILARQRNVQVLLATATDIDVERREVIASSPAGTVTVPYDYLIVATGAGQSYFGNDDFAEFAPGLKSLDDALELRGRIFGAFEVAELTTEPEAREALLTFTVIGAGPTGVEMAGQIAELAHRTLRHDFRSIDPRTARVLLVDGASEPLATFGPGLSAYAVRQLERIGVTVWMDRTVVGMGDRYVDLRDRDGHVERVPSVCKVWAAGVRAAAFADTLAVRTGAEQDRVGRIRVADDCSVPGHPEIFVVGDMMALDDLPGVAQVAMQGGRHAARQIRRELDGSADREPFHYFDKGSMATISRFSAVARIGRVAVSGFVAWLMWLVVHLMYLVGFKNRTTTLLHWAVSFIGRGRAERSGTIQQVLGRRAIEQANAQGDWSLPASPAAPSPPPHSD